MRVSELARRVGIAPSAIRFYERRGVLPTAARSPSGYRRYDEADVARLRLIVTLRKLGVPPATAGRMVAAAQTGQGEQVLGDLVPFVSRQRVAIEQQLADLRLLDATLVDLEATVRTTVRRPRSMRPRRRDRPIRVLFVCTGNSARSQIAEAMLRRLGGARFDVSSAGTRPRGVHPLTVHVLGEVGIDWSDARSKPVDTMLGRPFDYVVTVCDRARRSCPRFPHEPRSLHWGLSDPARVRGTEEERADAFRRTLSEIVTRLEVFVQLAGGAGDPRSGPSEEA
jgi:arsenate reductase (thioredoxin)